METAEHREPCESRGSRTDLGAPGGEIPPGDSTIRIERTHGSDDVDIPMSPELQAACEAMPKAHLNYIVTAYGKPRSKHGLGLDFAEWVSKAGLPKRCRLHGLKKAGMRRRAERDNTVHELMACKRSRRSPRLLP
jgi:hypothetical protein